jgi:hypothetical protein
MCAERDTRLSLTTSTQCPTEEAITKDPLLIHIINSTTMYSVAMTHNPETRPGSVLASFRGCSVMQPLWAGSRSWTLTPHASHYAINRNLPLAAGNVLPSHLQPRPCTLWNTDTAHQMTTVLAWQDESWEVPLGANTEPQFLEYKYQVCGAELWQMSQFRSAPRIFQMG